MAYSNFAVQPILGGVDMPNGVALVERKRWPYCDCAEGFVLVYDASGTVTGRKRMLVANPHDCDYIRERNALIPEATRIANALHHSDSMSWTTAFSEAMNRLVQEKIFKKH